MGRATDFKTLYKGCVTQWARAMLLGDASLINYTASAMGRALIMYRALEIEAAKAKAAARAAG